LTNTYILYVKYQQFI